MSEAPLDPPSTALAELLDAERAQVAHEPLAPDFDAARDRVLARLAATLGPLDAPVPTPPPPPAPLVPPATPPIAIDPASGLGNALVRSPLGMLVTGLVTGLIIGGAATAAWLPQPTGLASPPGSAPARDLAPPPATETRSTTDAPAASTLTTATASASPSPDAREGAAASAANAAHKAASSARSDDGRDPELERERALLDVARGALARQNGALALSSLDEHARRFPKGRLSEERDTLRIRSLEIAGRGEEAARRRAAFSSAYPDSFALPPASAAPKDESKKKNQPQ